MESESKGKTKNNWVCDISSDFYQLFKTVHLEDYYNT